jgi:agmatine deiminase
MSHLIESTPHRDGFRMPGEFEPHEGCWMLWPERPDNWRLGAKPAQKAFAAVASAIARFERVTMGVSAAQFQNARNLLPGHIRVVELSYNDSWMRDCGPTFVTNGKIARVVDWDFNAWGGLDGGLYFPWDQDDLVARKVAEIEWVDRYKAPLVLEGGSIHVDGQGTLLTTEECLLNPNRNPHLSKSEIENLLMEYLNVEKILWLGKGVYNETSIRDKSFLHQLSNFRPPPASPKIAGAILGEVQVGVIGIACQVLILSRTHLKIRKPPPPGDWRRGNFFIYRTVYFLTSGR